MNTPRSGPGRPRRGYLWVPPTAVKQRAIAVALVLAACAGPAADRRTFVEAHVARYRDEACGTHWSGNPVHAQCLAQLAWEAERAWSKGKR